MTSLKKRFPSTVIILTTLIAGTLDITAALIHSYIRSGVSPISVLKFIASGVAGNDAFEGGFIVALIGLLFHYFITFIWTTFFFAFYREISYPSKYKVLVGLTYGVLIWLIMNLIVLPLSNVPQIPFRFSQVLIGISFIMLLVGLPISLMFYRHFKNNT